MATAANFIPPDEYLRLERASEEKHEYADGQMFAMAGVNRKHRRIMDNVLVSFWSRRAESGCMPNNSETRLYIPATGRYTYADVVLTCGEKEVHQDDVMDTLLNPTLIVEVLSKSTEAYDRGKKFFYYQSIPSFGEYLLISQDEVLVEYRVRLAGHEWKQRFYGELAEIVQLEKSGFALPVAAIYEGVVF